MNNNRRRPAPSLAGIAVIAWMLGSQVALAETPAVAARPPLIPATSFAQASKFSDPLLSPGGQQILARTVIGGRERVLVHDLVSAKSMLLPVSSAGELRWYRWAGESRVLLSMAWSAAYEGEDILFTRLFVVDLASKESRMLAEKSTGPVGDDLLYVDPQGDWILLAQQRSIYDYPAVFRYELSKRDHRTVVGSVENVWQWFADATGVVRIGIGFKERSWFLMYRRSGDRPFERGDAVSYDDPTASIDLARLAQDTDEGYVLSNERTGRYGVYRYDYAKRSLGTPVFEHATNDVDEFEVSPDGRTVLGAWYTDDRPRVRWFQPDLARRQAELEGVFAGKQVYIASASRDYTHVIAWVGSTAEPGGYYYFDAVKRKVDLLAQVNGVLDVKQLAPTTYEHYKARDGLEIPAYLTLPVGRAPKGLPLIVLPHGGPYFVRDSLGYDVDVQFLANRGYAVLQPNFRGSTGYGKDFANAGWGQWGRGMQDDLDDGVDWLAKAGIVDAARVCVVGGSYGGYAALWAVTRNPERYRCAASFAGVTDVKKQLRYQASQLKARDRLDWRQTVTGDGDFDLDSISPLRQAARLTRPVLVAHGDADARVPFKQSSAYRDALTKAAKPHEFVGYPGEGHGLEDPVHEADWLERLGAFLEKYNPAEVAPEVAARQSQP